MGDGKVYVAGLDARNGKSGFICLFVHAFRDSDLTSTLENKHHHRHGLNHVVFCLCFLVYFDICVILFYNTYIYMYSYI